MIIRGNNRLLKWNQIGYNKATKFTKSGLVAAICRRLMESQVGAEVRRIHVIYFLSRKGRIEHPHLIRVHHLSRNGVHLRDVKRWLGELRGKEMPESFAWSYKRRYKNGYVWQDLLDEDLITPISDNEYVLKGSEISSTCSQDDSLSEKQSPRKEEMAPDEEGNQHHQETKMAEPRKTLSEIERESPSFGSEKSTLTEDSLKLEEEKHSENQFKEETHDQEEDDKIEDHSLCSTTSSKKNKNGNNVNMQEKNSTPASVSSAHSATFSRSKSNSSHGASLLFRNLMSCGAVETNDSAMMTISKCKKPSLNVSFTKQNRHSTELTNGDQLGGSQRVFGTTLNQQPQYAARRSFDGVRSSTKNKSEFSNQKAAKTAAFKPINGPPCSQCGKPFKPEKLHAHMKSCKGMKALAKGGSPAISAASVDKASDRSSEFPFNNIPVSGYYLMQRQ